MIISTPRVDSGGDGVRNFAMMPLGMQEAGRFPPPFFPSLQAAVEQVTGKRMVGVIAPGQSDTEDLERGGTRRTREVGASRASKGDSRTSCISPNLRSR